jgi:hypothetical protein
VLSGHPEGIKTKTGCPIENFGHDRHVEMIFHSIIRILIIIEFPHPENNQSIPELIDSCEMRPRISLILLHLPLTHPFFILSGQLPVRDFGLLYNLIDKYSGSPLLP